MIPENFLSHKPQKNFFVGIDSDGTVFDSMELKHKNCFIGSLIRVFDLAAITHEVHIVWNHVNIFSMTRGTNRFKALLLTFNYLSEMKRIKELGVHFPNLMVLKNWIDNTNTLSNESLKRNISKRPLKEKLVLDKVLEWSEEVNRMVKVTVLNLSPMKGAFKALKILKNHADVVVISNTPLEALQREWSENKIDKNVLFIGGQETGTKTEMLKTVAENKYDPKKILIIGDAPGDLKAAQNINGLFFPILPLKEEISWGEFNTFGYKHFINNSYQGEYQKRQIQKFQSILDLSPPWGN